MDRLIEQVSVDADKQRRKQLAWTIERKLAEESRDRSSSIPEAEPAGSLTSRG
jgi:hypothetical protein